MHNWKALSVDNKLLLSKEFETFGGIEELSNYSIITKNGNMEKCRKRKRKNSFKKNKKPKHNINDSHVTGDENPKEMDMSAWCNCFVPDLIMSALKDLKFESPTPIQKLAIPAAIRDCKDILGAAETGSGKTLAFGIPILSSILSMRESKNNKDCMKKPLVSLILTPTRELAVQIKNNLQAIAKYTDVMISIIVGGMAAEKQKRILKKCPDIVVATPGRLWELIEEGEPHLKLESVKHLVIDEADRMLEKGHFTELTKILSIMNGDKSCKRQTFVFSATLTLLHEMPNRVFQKRKEKLQQKNKLDSFIKMIGMKEKPEVIDLTKKTVVVDTLTESQIMCSVEDKDTYLYYFLTVHFGRTLVFCNSIDSVRRLRSVLEYLNCNPLPLHASMHQKQRLKNLEKFAVSETAVLLATDVAARGLDIKGIDYVIHFQVPRTAETYVHRSGRTARAKAGGLSLMLIEPQEGVFYKRICKTLNKEKAIPPFPIDNNILKAVRERVSLVREIDKVEHRMKRLTAQNRWFINAAKEMDVDIEEENLLNDLESNQRQSKVLNAMKRQLKNMLCKPIMLKSLTGSYPTKSGKLQCPVVSKKRKLDFLNLKN